MGDEDVWVGETLAYEDARYHGGDWDQSWRNRLAVCDEDVRIGRYCLFHSPLKVFLKGRARFDPFLNATCGVQADDAVHVSSHVFLNGGPKQAVKLYQWSFVGSGSRLITASDDFTGKHGPIGPAGQNRMDRGDITFNRFAGVAVGCTVLPGVVLPEGCCIAAHGLVSSSEGLEPWGCYVCAPGKKPRLLYMRDAEAVKRLAEEW